MTRKKKPKDMPPRSSPAVSVESSVSTGPSASAPVLPITAFPSERSSDLEVPKLPESLIAPASLCPVNLQSSPPPEVAESEKANSQISATVVIVPEDESTEATSGLLNSGKYPQIAILPAPVSPKSPIANRKSPPSNGTTVQTSLWKEKVSPNSGRMDTEGTPFLLDSGEACVKIPNSVIERNKKAWDSFIIGQFYEEAPARGAVQAIVNGMWSKH